ncbi:hypothetical protein DMB65_10015 [Flavobacterium cheongpyeongense]|uniref:Uncharacterized protein n=1 Tax=Flavobacterium cheongpyeongense TaxID=2212651 RepID=A0A2V4BST5_9FLAO|nr:hypothetical protein DMB65_10015 [Flavobacterium cheongpyeongense]
MDKITQKLQAGQGLGTLSTAEFSLVFYGFCPTIVAVIELSSMFFFCFLETLFTAGPGPAVPSFGIQAGRCLFVFIQECLHQQSLNCLPFIFYQRTCMLLSDFRSKGNSVFLTHQQGRAFQV